MPNRRHAITALAMGFSLFLTACGGGKPVTPIAEGDVVFGNPSAPVTVIEYASLACPGCAAFNNQHFAAFKAKYIDTGQIKFVLREMTTHDARLSTIAFLLARCAGKEKYLEVADAVYKAQPDIDVQRDPGNQARIRPTLLGIAKSAGLNEQQFDTCIQDPASIEAFNARVTHNTDVDGIHSTPTFTVNGKEVDASPEALDKAIAEAKAGGAPAPASTPAPAAPAAPAK